MSKITVYEAQKYVAWMIEKEKSLFGDSRIHEFLIKEVANDIEKEKEKEKEI